MMSKAQGWGTLPKYDIKLRLLAHARPLVLGLPLPRALPYIEILNIGMNSYSLGDI
jgi:hypothetical protein